MRMQRLKEALKTRNGIAALTYFIFFAPYLAKWKNDPFVRFHFKQSVALVITALAAQGVISILGYWGFGGRALLVWALRIFMTAMAIIGARSAWSGKTNLLPWIGEYGAKF